MKILNLIILFVILTVITSILTLLVLKSNYVVGTRTIHTDVMIEKFIAFNLDSDALHFGAVRPGGSAQRGINITNDYDQELKIQIIVKGQMSNWLGTDSNSFTLSPKQTKTVDFNLVIPQGTSYGNYTGTVYVVYLKP